MKSIKRDFIEYISDEDEIPEYIENFNYINIHKQLDVIGNGQGIEQISKVYTTAKILNNKLIKTPKGESLEGIKLTGNRLVVYGEVLQRIQYVAQNESQTMHIYNFSFAFMNFVDLPECYEPSKFYVADVYVEDVNVCKVSSHRIYSNLNLLIHVDL